MFVALSLTGCASVKPVIRTVNDVAVEACSLYFGKRQGISLKDAARAFCATEDALKPWIDALLSAQRDLDAAPAIAPSVSPDGAGKAVAP